MLHFLAARARGEAVARMNLGHWMILDEDVTEQKHALESGEYETRTVLDCLRLVPPDGVFLDIGANIGFFTCAFAAIDGYFKGTIHAFEPVGGNFRRLRRNIALNRLTARARAVRTALGARPGRMKIHIVPGGAANNAVGEAMLTDADREIIAREGWRSETVDVVRLDDWAARRKLARCDLIKIDVEGAECFVLEGAKTLIGSCRPAIVGEFSPYWLRGAGRSFDDAIALLGPLGYRFYVDRGGTYEPLNGANAPDGDEIPTYLLLPEEKLDLLDRLVYD
jgi:FkbM family methyltransferase